MWRHKKTFSSAGGTAPRPTLYARALRSPYAHNLYSWIRPWREVRGATTAEKLRGTKVWVPIPGSLRPAPGQRPGWVLGTGGVPPLAVRCCGITPGNFFENSNAKSCILVTACCEISCFLKTTAKKLGTNSLLVPNLKVGGTSHPGPYGCCAYAREAYFSLF